MSDQNFPPNFHRGKGQDGAHWENLAVLTIVGLEASVPEYFMPVFPITIHVMVLVGYTPGLIPCSCVVLSSGSGVSMSTGKVWQRVLTVQATT